MKKTKEIKTEDLHELVNVYLAGKIKKNDWRHEIFRDLRNGKINNYILEPVDGCVYRGPFFISCDHGCYHGEGTHGRGVNEYKNCGSEKEDSVFEVIEKCEDWIRDSQIMFCWIDSKTAYGTLVEIGIAKGLGIPIFIACSEKLKESKYIKDIWFACMAASNFIYAGTATEAWKQFVEWKVVLNCGSSIRKKDYATPYQKKYIRDLLKKNNYRLKKSLSIDRLLKNDAGSIINFLTQNNNSSEGALNLIEHTF